MTVRDPGGCPLGSLCRASQTSVRSLSGDGRQKVLSRACVRLGPEHYIVNGGLRVMCPS
jgi:hypothetical protein